MRKALTFAAYTAARSLYPLLAAALIWGTLLWTPAVTLVLAFFFLHLATRVEEVPFLERFCRHLRIAGRRAGGEDAQPVIFYLLTIANYASAFFIYQTLIGSNAFARICFLLGAGTMLGWTAGINLGVVYHNHLHRGTFRSGALNRWAGRLWTIPSGWPSYFWQYKHTVVHHPHVGEEVDWVQPRVLADGRYESIYRYVLCHWPWRYARHLWADFSGPSRRLRRKAMREVLLFLPLWIVPFFIDPLMALGLWIYPHWFGSAFILGTGMYTQHAGGTAAQKYSGSTTFLSEYFNLTMFNVGYHTEHHANPSTHWSDLPDLHARLRQELIDGGAHIVPYGSYGASRILSSIVHAGTAFDTFRQQHPAYVPGEAGYV